jgi:hypothetical protein
MLIDYQLSLYRPTPNARPNPAPAGFLLPIARLERVFSFLEPFK